MSVNYVALGKRIGYFRMQCGNITQEALASKIKKAQNTPALPLWSILPTPSAFSLMIC